MKTGNDKDNEVWRDIKGYEGKYQISSEGQVRSLERWVKNTGNASSKRKIKERLLKPVKFITKEGFVNSKVRLYASDKDGGDKWHSISKLVAEEFIGERPKGVYIRHNNGRSLDNRVDNLRYDRKIKRTK